MGVVVGVPKAQLGDTMKSGSIINEDRLFELSQFNFQENDYIKQLLFSVLYFINLLSY